MMSSDDVEQLKEIFEELSVGVSGYLDMQELSIVCEHIGMDSIEDQVKHYCLILFVFISNFKFTEAML